MSECVLYQSETAHGTQELSIESMMLLKRRIMIDNETFSSEGIKSFFKKWLYLQESSEPITVYINSTGGEVNAGLLVYDIIQSSKSPVDIYCAGVAYSMAAVVLAAGWKGRRFILPHSRVMIHEPLIAGGVGGSATSISRVSESILETRQTLNGILAQHTGKTVDEINAATAFDNMMNAEQAVEFGICDKVVDSLF